MDKINYNDKNELRDGNSYYDIPTKSKPYVYIIVPLFLVAMTFLVYYLFTNDNFESSDLSSETFIVFIVICSVVIISILLFMQMSKNIFKREIG